MDKIKKLRVSQHEFFRYLAFKVGIPEPCDNQDYLVITKSFNIGSVKSVKSIRITRDLGFI